MMPRASRATDLFLAIRCHHLAQEFLLSFLCFLLHLRSTLVATGPVVRVTAGRVGLRGVSVPQRLGLQRKAKPSSDRRSSLSPHVRASGARFRVVPASPVAAPSTTATATSTTPRPTTTATGAASFVSSDATVSPAAFRHDAGQAGTT